MSQSERRRPAKSRKTSSSPRPLAPTKAETALLSPFPGLKVEQVHLPRSQAECRQAVDHILAAGVAGFDTEARPTFRVGEKSDGPHLVQFALTDRAYLFQLHRSECEKASAELISSTQILKVGFGLKNDREQIRDRLGIDLQHVLDLDQIFRQLGYRGQIGVRGAMGSLLKLGFKKSKSTTTSNWARRELSTSQILYAANDAYAALTIMDALKNDGMLQTQA